MEFWVVEAKAVESPQQETSKSKGYQQIRESVARGTLRAIHIARQMGVPLDMRSYPAPAVGGPIIPVNLFDAVLHDTSWGGVHKQWILDGLDQTVGACEERAKAEFRRLVNPFYWILEVLRFIIRIPFVLIEASGFNVSKVEDHLLAKAFKLLEIVAIIYILLRLGINQEQLQQFLKALFSK
jgi:hypothetical protein